MENEDEHSLTEADFLPMENRDYRILFSRENGLIPLRQLEDVPEEMEIIYQFIVDIDRYLMQPRPRNMAWTAHQCFLFDARKIAMATWEFYCSVRDNSELPHRYRNLADGPPTEANYHDDERFHQPLQVLVDRLGLRYQNPDPWDVPNGGGDPHASAIARILGEPPSLTRRRRQPPPGTDQSPPPRLPSPFWPDDYFPTVAMLRFLEPVPSFAAAAPPLQANERWIALHQPTAQPLAPVQPTEPLTPHHQPAEPLPSTSHDQPTEPLPSTSPPPTHQQHQLPPLPQRRPVDILHHCLGEMVAILKIKHDKSARRFSDIPQAERRRAVRFLCQKAPRIGYRSYDEAATKQNILRLLANAWNIRHRRHRLVVKMN
ncbi:unnamed protein product [Absidia cylindrospora]